MILHSNFPFGIVFLFILFIGNVHSTSYPPNYRFEHLSIEEGLSQTSVVAITQDLRGFLWFATRGGLNRYDGNNFKIYNSDILSDNSILALAADEYGYVWIGMESGGLSRINILTEEIEHYLSGSEENGISSNHIQSLYIDKKKRLWVGTVGGGLNLYQRYSNNFRHYIHDPSDSKSLCGNFISQLTEDNKGNLWIATSKNGVCVYDLEKNEFHPIEYTATPNEKKSVLSIYADSKGIIWIGAVDGLFEFHPDKGLIRKYTNDENSPARLSDKYISAIIENNDGKIWLGTTNSLNILDPESGKIDHIEAKYYDEYSLSGNYIISIYKDNAGVLWLGTASGGVNKYSPRHSVFRHFTHIPHHINSLSNKSVWAVKHLHGYLWIGTTNGLNRYDHKTNKYKLYNKKLLQEGINRNIILSIISDNNNGLWLGSLGGLSHLDVNEEKFTSYIYPFESDKGISHNYILSAAMDSHNHLWLGTRGAGVHIFNTETKTFKNLSHDNKNPNSLSNNFVYGVHVDKEGMLWFMTLGGINKYNSVSQQFIHFRHEPDNQNSLVDNSVRHILEDEDGIFWFGTDNGLSQYDSKTEKFTNYTTTNGLINNFIYAIEKDTNGHIWVSTNRGLSKINPHTQFIQNYDSNSGLPVNEFNGGSPAYDGQYLYFGSINGVIIFDPNDIKPNTVIAPVRITDFQIFNQSVPLPLENAIDRSIHVSYKDSFFSIEFASLDYTAPSRNQYAYMLEGYDKDWIVSGNRRFASYTNLDGGSYTFKVKGTNSDGLWNEKGTSINIDVEPPPWKTWWANILYGLFIITILMGVVVSIRRKMALEQAKEHAARLCQIDKIKDEFLANTSHELRTPLNGIIGLTELLAEEIWEKVSDENHHQLDMIVASGKRLSTLINDILDYSKLKKSTIELRKKPVDLYGIVDVVFCLSKPLVGNKAVRLLNSVASTIPMIEGDENRLQQIFMNIVGNAIKFTTAGDIEITARCAGNMIEVNISDQGKGIPAGKLSSIFDSFEQVDGSVEREYGGTSLGLAITKKLLNLHGSEIKVESTVDVGSRFTFSLPIAESTTDGGSNTNATKRMNKKGIKKDSFKKDSFKKGLTTSPATNTKQVATATVDTMAKNYTNTMEFAIADDIHTSSLYDFIDT